MKPLLVYCYDAYCGWSYAFAPIMQKIARRYQSVFEIEVISGGMIMPERPKHISVMANYMLQLSREIESGTGVRFGQDFLWHLENPDLSDWYPGSLKPAIALSIIKNTHPDQQLQFAIGLGNALYAEGRDLCDDEAYRNVLSEFGISAEEFFRDLRDPAYELMAREDFTLVKQLGIGGYPALLVQANENKIIRLFEGYRSYENTETIIINLLSSIN